jgi:pimeloyl-ACP methyl ester carboxylesterase
LRRWLAERMDDAMLPLLKLLSRGYRRRLPPFSDVDEWDIGLLANVKTPGDVRLCDEPSWLGYATRQFAFETPIPPRHQQNRMVSGRIIAGDPSAPWVLLVPGYSTGAAYPYNYGFFQTVQGHTLLKSGFNVALMELPFHMGRKPPGGLSGEGFFTPDLAQTQEAVIQAAADAIATVRWLEALSGRPVGVWGTSLGGCVAGLVATRVPELPAVVLMEPMDNPGDILATLRGTWEIRAELARHGVGSEQIPQRLRTVAPSSYPPAVAPERILFVTPQYDRVVPTRFQDAFWSAWGRPERILVPATHTTTAARPDVVLRAAQFLARYMLT